MFSLQRLLIAVATLWIFACVVWFSIVVRRWFAHRETATHRDFPVLVKLGILWIGLAPVISAIQYVATGHRYFWSGAFALFCGLFLIFPGSVFHLLLARRWASRLGVRPRRPTATTFREKSIVVQIAMILAVYGFFGVRLWGFWDQPSMSSAAAGSIVFVVTLIAITICMIIIGIASHVALVLYARSETSDERDRVIGLRGSRNAYGVLVVGIWCVLYLAIADIPHGALLYAIMGVFALAELVRLGSQLVYYRFNA